jgi:formylglycine-generating enzyme required for sulfatase activity
VTKTARRLSLALLVAAMVVGAAFWAHAIDDEPSPPPKPPADPAKALYDKAVKLAEQGNTEQATKALEGIIALYPSSPYAAKAQAKLDALRQSPAPPPPPRGSPSSSTIARLGYTMVRVPAGKFLMGSPGDEPGREDDEAQHWVTITKPFLLGATEVTQGQWQKVMGNNPSHFQNCGADCPVEQVSWNDVIDFCNKLSDLEGLTRCYSGTGNAIQWDRACTGYRLPTEAEWEYAARAGTTTALYTGPLTIAGDHNGPELDPIAWYGGNSGVNYSGGADCSGWSNKQYSSSTCGTHPVARKRGNDWGLYDMLGNVWELTWDWYGSYPSGSVTDPTGPGGGSGRVGRGGGWSSGARGCRSALRGNSAPGLRFVFLGFRLSRSVR